MYWMVWIQRKEPDLVARTEYKMYYRWFPELTEGLLVDYEAADDAFVAAAEGEAVPSEDDVEGLWGM